MRLFETIILVLLILAGFRIAFRLFPYKRQPDFLLTGGLLLALGLHLILEGPRWQMLPVYLLAAGLVLVMVLRLVQYHMRLPVWSGWLILFLSFLFSLPPMIFPVPQLPEPRGPYAVGTTSFYWVDQDRIDPYDGSPRRLMVQMWYPTDPNPSSNRAPYFEQLDIAGPTIARQYNLPPFIFNHLSLITTNSISDAPAAGGSDLFPVLLFSHGWTGLRNQNTFQMEELASHGYVILAADHTYGAAVTVFPDGKIAYNNPDALPEVQTVEEYDRAARILGKAYVEDLIFLLGQAGRLQNGELPNPLAGRLNLQEIGALGHSTGGGAALEFCFVDVRCKAVLTMDAWLIPYDRKLPQVGLDKPLLMMQSETWTARRNPPLSQALFDHSESPAYRMTITGTGHYDFSDLPFISPVSSFIGLKGPLPTLRVMDIINTFSVSFFNEAFQKEDIAGIQELDEQFIEVQLVVKE